MRGPTGDQVQAVYEVMRLLREEDRERGLAAGDLVACDTCHRARPAAGSVRYGDRTLCNGCATDYELLRLARLIPRLEV